MDRFQAKSDFSQPALYRPDLLTLARKARSLTQTDLARLSGISQPTVSRLEEQHAPTAEQISRLATVLGFPTSFFFQPDPIYGFGIGELFHRRRKTISTKVLDTVHAEINIRCMVLRRLLKAVDLPEVDLPVLDQADPGMGVEDAARALRARWHLPTGPIRSVTDTLNKAGILIVPGRFETHQVDAIGLWPMQLPPLIFVNTRVTQDRLRLTLMHEVAHFVLHAGWGLDLGPDIEAQANRFSAEFLMPAREIAPQLHSLTLQKLAQLKRHWRVSMAALLVRAKDLDTISSRRYQSLWTEMGKLGFRRREPQEFDVTGESPGSTFAEILRIHVEELRYSAKDLANMTNLEVPEFEDKYLECLWGPRPVPPRPFAPTKFTG